MATYFVITSNAKGGAASPFTGDTAQVVEMTEQELRQVYNDSGQIQDHFGTFDNYMTYIGESQDWIQSAEWMNATMEYKPSDRKWLHQMGEDVMWKPGEREQLAIQIGYDQANAKQSEYLGWLNAGAELLEKWGLNDKRVIYNSDGDQFKWTGSGYQKTVKVDDHASFGDYAKAILKTAVIAAATYGIGNTAVGAELTKAFTHLGLSPAAASAATSSIVSSGVGAAIGEDVTFESVIVGALGAGIGAEVAGLAGLTGAAGSALSSATASAIEQAIIDGEIDFNELLQSGLLGAGTNIATDLFDALVKGGTFDFGGLIDENSDLFKFFNGAPNIYGDYVGGLLGDIRGGFNEFVEKYITGGEWWSSATESYNNIDILPNGTVVAFDYDGSETTFNSFEEFVNAGFTEMSGTNPIWEMIGSGLDKIPDSWYDTLEDWLTNASSSSGGTYQTENGTTITTTTTGTGADDDGEGEDPSLFDCSTVNRVQTPSALEAADCGPCIEGYQADEFGECVQADTTDVCPAGQVYNEVVGACVDELFFTPGQPCNTDDGQQGVFDDEGGCYVPAGTNGGTGTDDDDGDDGDSTGTTGTNDDSCSNGATVESGCELCEDGTRPDEHQGGRCSGAYIDPQDPHGCSAGKPSPATFAIKTWYAMCEADYCNDGSRKQTVDGVYGANCAEYVAPTPIEPCADPDRRTTNSGSCAELCNDGTIPDQHEDGLCGNPMIATTGGEAQNGDGEDADCTLVECDSPRPEGAEGVQWDKCCTDVTTTTTGEEGEEPDCTLVECDAPRPEGIEGDLWDQCCTDTTTATTGSSGSNGGSSLGGGNLFEGVDFQTGITRDPSLEVAMQFPITNFLAGIFTDSTGGRNV